MAEKGWFEVDRRGLGRLLERRGKSFAVFELVQNAWDTDTGEVRVELVAVPGKPLARLRVEDDDPTGFQSLAHAYTLFADSAKKGDPGKRGRFNLGEKLVLALCAEATVSSTTGTVSFSEGGRVESRARRERGSLFEGVLRLTREELDGVLRDCRRLIPPVRTTINGVVLPRREALATFEAVLPTVVADEEGCLTRTRRKAAVSVYRLVDGEVGHLYELGIPVVETGDSFHVDVGQKVPVNLDRDNVPPGYLSQLRGLVLDAVGDDLTAEQAASAWVDVALEQDGVSARAVKHVLRARYGEKLAVHDLSDPEANSRLVSEGYAVIRGGAFSKRAWANVRASGAALPSGVVSPTPKPYSTDPGAPQVRVVPASEQTEAVRRVVELAERLGSSLLGHAVAVRVVRTTNGFSACYGEGRLDFNLLRLGHRFFEAYPGDAAPLLSLLIHEFAHEYSSDHLDSAYHRALSDLGGRLAALLHTDPGILR